MHWDAVLLPFAFVDLATSWFFSVPLALHGDPVLSSELWLTSHASSYSVSLASSSDDTSWFPCSWSSIFDFCPERVLGCGRASGPAEVGNKILLDQGIVTKQTMLKHAEHICKMERNMRAICEFILEARPKEEEPRVAMQKPTG